MEIENLNRDTERYKDRVFVQGHEDEEKEFLPHESKTVRYVDVTLMINLTAILLFQIGNPDVTQAYIQGTYLTRAVYVEPTTNIKNIISNF